MIEQRHQWLLRDDSTMFESVDAPRGSGQFGCKVCAARGETVRVLHSEFRRHGSDHRREKVVRSPVDDFIGQTVIA